MDATVDAFRNRLSRYPPKFNIAPEGLPKSSRNGLSSKHHFSNFGDSDSVPFEANKNPKDPCMV